jgi:hypothetical protein
MKERGSMKTKNAIVGIAVTLAAGASFAGTAHASGSVPVVGQVDTKMVLPSTLTTSGQFEIEILAGPGSHDVCSFYLYRYTSASGSWSYLGDYSGESTTDTVYESLGYIEYEMVPFDCSSNEGSAQYSNEFTPYIFSYSAFDVTAGSWEDTSSSKDYDGHSLETLTRNATVTINDENAYNDGIIVETGPTGGIGTVYVNGTKMSPTINFYSKSPGYEKLEFKFGTYVEQTNTFKIVATGKGKKGGYDMWFTALAQIY